MKMSRVEVSVHTALAVLGAILIATYILFGVPSHNEGMPKRKKRKKGFVPGLINLGNTCFLNCILQSLASCTSFTNWVNQHTLHQAPPILLTALRKLLYALNKDVDEDFTSAEEVLRALRSHGWVIAPEEQDAHELFHALTSTLDDEVLLIREQSNSLLNISWVTKNIHEINNDKEVLNFDDKDCSQKYDFSEIVLSNKNSNIEGNMANESNSIYNSITDNSVIIAKNELTKSSKIIKDENFEVVSCEDDSIDTKTENIVSKLDYLAEHNLVTCRKSIRVDTFSEDAALDNIKNTSISDGSKCIKSKYKEVSVGLTKVLDTAKVGIGSKSHKDLSIISKVPSSLHHNFFYNQKNCVIESPFKGHLASQLQCAVCGFKNAEQWSTFESLSLFMPNDFPLGHFRCTLHNLLDAFVRPESVADVTCEGCTKVKKAPSQSIFAKKLTIGKLPDCLCFHIQRTVWLENNCAVKRKEFVAFPVKINMEPYTYTVSLSRQEALKEGGLLGGRESCNEYSNLTLERPITSLKRRNSSNEDLQSMDILPNFSIKESLSSFRATDQMPLHGITASRLISKEHGIYLLKAVVVHVGDIFSGHFVTYRKGPENTSIKDKWFYTSDATVREATLDEVLKSSAYMILYERMNL